MPKAETLIANLTDAERKRLTLVMKSHKRDSLRQLFRYLVKVALNEGAFDKDKAFRTAFGRVYSADEDYLLRNELRLLVSEIHNFMREEELQQECESNTNFNDTLLLNSLLKHRCFDELERLFPKAFASSLERLNFEQARRQSDIYFKYLIFYRPITPDTLEEGRGLMAEQMRILKILYRTGALLNQNNRATCEAMLAMMNRPVEVLVNPVLDTDFSNAETPFIRFMEAIFNAQLESDLDRRIVLARTAVESISQVQKIYPMEKLLALGTLATLYYIKDQYVAAREIFEQTIAYAHEANLPATINRVELLHNYVGTLMRLGDYNKALEVMDEYRELIAKHEKLVLRFDGLRCFCYIFLRRPAEAFAAVPSSSTYHLDYEHLYFRFIYAVIPYLNGDVETAHRESVNLEDYFHRHEQTSLFPEQRYAATALRKFYAALLSSPDSIARKLQRLGDELEAKSATSQGKNDTFVLVWLRHEITLPQKELF